MGFGGRLGKRKAEAVFSGKGRLYDVPCGGVFLQAAASSVGMPVSVLFPVCTEVRG